MHSSSLGRLYSQLSVSGRSLREARLLSPLLELPSSRGHIDMTGKEGDADDRRRFEDPDHAAVYRRVRPGKKKFIQKTTKNVTEICRKFYSKVAECINAAFFAVHPASLVDRIVSLLGVDRRRLAVDVGCGSGQATFLLAPRFDSVLGVDASAEMVRQAEEAARVTGGCGNVEFK